MAKRIIQQARGKGSSTYRVRKKAFKYKIQYPRNLSSEKGKVLKFLNSPAHTCPLAKVKYSKGVFFMPAFKGMIEGQEIECLTKEINNGNIVKLENVPIKTEIYNIESIPNDGGKFIKTGGNSGFVSRKIGNKVFVVMPSKKEKAFHVDSKATIGTIAGEGRLNKPLMKAGKKYYIKKTKSKLWPRTSAVKMNAIDHPFGSGRGKNPKSKIAKRNAPPGRKVGLLRPKRTGKKN